MVVGARERVASLLLLARYLHLFALLSGFRCCSVTRNSKDGSRPHSLVYSLVISILSRRFSSGTHPFLVLSSFCFLVFCYHSHSLRFSCGPQRLRLVSCDQHSQLFNSSGLLLDIFAQDMLSLCAGSSFLHLKGVVSLFFYVCCRVRVSLVVVLCVIARALSTTRDPLMCAPTLCFKRKCCVFFGTIFLILFRLGLRLCLGLFQSLWYH